MRRKNNPVLVLALALVLLLGISADSLENVPGLIWERTYGGPNWDWCFSMIEVSSGGFLMAGFTDPTLSTYGGVNWLVRTDAEGNQLWNRTYGNPTGNLSGMYSIQECEDGGFAIAGSIEIFGSDEEASTNDFWLVRTDSSGNHLWNRTYGGPQYEVCKELVVCQDGGFALYGWTNSFGAGDLDLYLVRANTDGEILWNRTYGSAGKEMIAGYGLAQCDDGGFVMVGAAPEPSSHQQVLLVRTDSDGNQLWNRTYQEVTWQYPTEIIVVDSGFLILAELVTISGLQLRAIRTNSTGDVVWNQACGYGEALSVVRCSSGGFAIVGLTHATEPPGAWLVRIDDNGNLLWDQVYVRSDRDELYAIVEYSGGGFAMAGQTEIDWEQGNYDFWLLRVADQAPSSPIGWIAAAAGGIIAVIALVVIWRIKRK